MSRNLYSMVEDAFTPIREVILRIGEATAERDYWGVLGIPKRSDCKQIQSAHRKWMRKLHRDRWFASADPELYNKIQEAFYQVQVAYFEALRLCALNRMESSEPAPIPMASSKAVSSDIPFFSWFIRLIQKIAPRRVNA